jgi:large subunit ribosomal protein L9
MKCKYKGEIMQVILRKDVQNLGEAGDMVNVKDGYARNFLLPQNFAETATNGAVKNREKNLNRIKAKQEKLHAAALENAEKINAIGTLELSVKAGESGKLFGTITTKKLAEEVQAKSGVEVDRKNISLSAPINKVGEYSLLIKLTSKVKTELPVSITASEVFKDFVEEEAEAVEEIIEE